MDKVSNMQKEENNTHPNASEIMELALDMQRAFDIFELFLEEYSDVADYYDISQSVGRVKEILGAHLKGKLKPPETMEPREKP